MMRIEVLHNHERHRVFGREMSQQFCGSFESAGRAADADNGAI
jgi:hypothetical protein